MLHAPGSVFAEGYELQEIMLASFIIPHKGREEFLERTLQSILQLEFDLQKIEIIVVTQNKNLESPTITQNNFHVEIVFCPEHYTIALLRNIGVQHASGEYLVFLDADVELSRNWLNAMFSELNANADRVLVSAIQQCGPNPGSIEKIKVLLNNQSADKPVEFIGTANLFLHRKTFERVGGFPEKLATCEDYYFTNTVHQIGEVYCSSKASFIHLGEDRSYQELFRKEIWRAQANLRSLQGRKILPKELPSILTPLWQAVFMLMIAFSLFIKHEEITFLSSALFGLPVILYAARIYRKSKGMIRFGESVWFYAVYLIARVIGTVTGLFKSIKS